MTTMSPPGYYHNGFVATHAFGHMMYTYDHVINLKNCSIIISSKKLQLHAKY